MCNVQHGLNIKSCYLDKHFYREDCQEYVHADINDLLQLQQSKIQTDFNKMKKNVFSLISV